MKQYAKHRVTVSSYQALILDPEVGTSSAWVSMIPSGKTYFDWEIQHPEECDKLKYGQQCCLDWLLEHDSEGMPDETGIYEVWAVDDSSFVNNWSHYGWEAQHYIQFNKLADLPDDYDQVPGAPESVV